MTLFIFNKIEKITQQLIEIHLGLNYLDILPLVFRAHEESLLNSGYLMIDIFEAVGEVRI
jgi:hypothetical protein